MSNDCGHYSYLSGRLARLRAVQAERGMSASALARLPKAPDLPEPIILQPVLATKAHATRFDLQLAAQERPRTENGKFAPSDNPRRQSPWSMTNRERSDRLQRAKAIVEMVAAVAKIEGFQIRAGDKRPRFSQPRAMAVYLLTELLQVPGGIMADMFGYQDMSTPRMMAHKVRRRLQFGQRQTVELHDRAMAAIKDRWPEYAQ